MDFAGHLATEGLLVFTNSIPILHHKLCGIEIPKNGPLK